MLSDNPDSSHNNSPCWNRNRILLSCRRYPTQSARPHRGRPQHELTGCGRGPSARGPAVGTALASGAISLGYGIVAGWVQEAAGSAVRGIVTGTMVGFIYTDAPKPGDAKFSPGRGKQSKTAELYLHNADGTATITDILCNGDNSGSIDLSLNSGTAPFMFNWSNNEQTEDINGLFAGNYTITVIDSNGCEMVDTYDIQQNEPFDVDTALSDINGYNISTFQGSDGTIELQIDGATAPYTYLWNTGDTTTSISG